MNQRIPGFALVACLLMLGNVLTPAKATAAEAGDVLDMLERACSKADGHFEKFRIYQVTGTAWASGASCFTPNARLTCRETFCKAVNLDRERVAMMKYKASPDLGRLVSPEHREFERVLRGLAVH